MAYRYQKEHFCVICAEPFMAYHNRNAVCSDKCRLERDRRKAVDWAAKNPEKISQMNKRHSALRLANGKMKTYQTARRSSKAGYIDRFLERIRVETPGSDITRGYLESLFGDVCAVSGVPFQFDRTMQGTAFKNPYAPSIDRIDSALPYQVGNIQIVLAAINFGKNAMSMDDFTKVWREITKSWAALTQGHY